MYHITFQQIHYFLTLAQTLNFTDTSQILYISQPTLSKQITALESELGFPLFIRTKRNVCLTPEGLLLAKEWTNIQDLMAASIYNAKLLNDNATGRLRIGCADTFEIDEDLMPVLKALQAKHPEIDLDFESLGFKALRNALYSNDFDIVFVPEFELPSYKDIEKMLFQKLELGIAVPTSNPLSNKEHVDITDLKDQPIITLSNKESALGVNKIKDYFDKYSIKPNIIKQVSNLNSLILALKNGTACTICHNKIKSPHIKIFDLADQPDDCNIYAVWKADYASVELELFKEMMKTFSALS